ncbi:MAG TPA: membrane protein insertion efficiency factor YidD [Abditibacterium sp.]|jgi:hypothetical protein
MLPRAQRLTTSQFDRAFSQSQTVRHPLVALRLHFRGDDGEVRAAFVVPKKQAKRATQRNLLRRRLRERFRLHPARQNSSLLGCDLIFLTTPQTADATMAELDAALDDVLRRAGRKAAQNAAQRGSTQVKIEENQPTEAENEAAQADSRSWTREPITCLALAMIRFYQRFISPGLPPSCRFEPSCSRYTLVAIERFGLWRGGFLGLSRLCRCHPWQVGGDDPVPECLSPAPWHQIRNPFLERPSVSKTEK